MEKTRHPEIRQPVLGRAQTLRASSIFGPPPRFCSFIDAVAPHPIPCHFVTPLLFPFPQVFPDLYKWVAYPVATLIKMLYAAEKVTTSVDKNRCPFRLELIASLERTLCFCHTGNTAVLATSLMRPLLLSKSVVKDGFPMLTTVFHQKRLCMAFDQGLIIDPSKWPAKDGYPAVASKRSQIVTYSLQHFMVSLCLYIHLFVIPCFSVLSFSSRVCFSPTNAAASRGT